VTVKIPSRFVAFFKLLGGFVAEIRQSSDSSAAASFQKNRETTLKQFLTQGPPPGSIQDSAALYTPGIHYRAVRTVDELKTAARLVYDEYLKLGYIHPNTNQMKVALWQLLPATVSVAAFDQQGRMLSTMTVIPDSPLGLPMDKLFKQELDNLRLDGRTLAEISMFASARIDSDGRPTQTLGQRTLMIYHLMRCASDYVRMETNVDIQVECFHPKHDGFYETLGHERLGELRHYGSVGGNPALARFLDIPKSLGAPTLMGRLMLLQTPPPGFFSDRLRLTAADIEELFVQHSNILGSASADKLSYLQTQYPDVDLTALAAKKSLLSHLIESLDNRTNLPYPESASKKEDEERDA
jgi:hypothetical protein